MYWKKRRFDYSHNNLHMCIVNFESVYQRFGSQKKKKNKSNQRIFMSIFVRPTVDICPELLIDNYDDCQAAANLRHGSTRVVEISVRGFPVSLLDIVQVFMMRRFCKKNFINSIRNPYDIKIGHIAFCGQGEEKYRPVRVRCRLFPAPTLTAAAVRRKCTIPKARALFILVAFLK
jgi:hypothetical protein